MDIAFRLHDFEVYNAPDVTRECGMGDSNSFFVKMFGKDQAGKSYSVTVEGFNPFFYVKVDEHWTISMKDRFVSHLKELMGRFYANSIVDSKLIKRKKLYGFDNFKQHKFIYLEFANTNAFKKASNLWYSDYQSGHTLLKEGFVFMDTHIYLYEATLPPLLRYFHVTKISPSGWIALPKKKVVEHTGESKTTKCDHHFSTHMKHIIPLPDKEDPVPFKIMSFDIEASSSHGDFPVPVKTYKKLATNIVEYLENCDGVQWTRETLNDRLRHLVRTAFGFSSSHSDVVDVVYPKKIYPEEYIDHCVDMWLATVVKNIHVDESFQKANTLESLFETMTKQMEVETEGAEEDGDGGGEEECAEFQNWGALKPKAYSKLTATIADVLLDSACERDTKLETLNKSLCGRFPPLEGDKVTFIGSTFMNYGDKDPHKNHCIVLGSCAEVPNCEIESYNTEREVLLAWQQLMDREDPDIVIGYNIFGFDYQFLFHRAEENDCVEEFLKLSRNKDEVCATRDRNTGKWKIEENTLQIASGAHELHLVKMAGRCQVDLHGFYRRNENLTSYKLDYVSGYMIGDTFTRIEHDNTQETTTVYTNNMTGLIAGNYIHIEEIGHSVEYYQDGAKFQVLNVNKGGKCFVIKGLIQPNFEKVARWCLAKDDVTPKDIFRLSNGTAEDRAIVAKYCIQDCNLVHYLFNKSDIWTGYVEMAKLCSVPISFLVMRGQGIKLQSLISDYCRSIKTLIPVIEKGDPDDAYEGADVLKPKCNLYVTNPVACNDYASLYPSCDISENLSHDSKVWTQEYDLAGNLVEEWGEKDERGNFIYDNLPDYEYVTVEYDTYRYVRKHPKAASQKVKMGHKICRFVQFKDGESAIIPAVLKKLLKARKDTRANQKKVDKNEFMWGVLEQRQLSCKVSANSIYGACGAKTSSFYEKDIAACTTAMGRKLLNYGKKIIEQCFGNAICETSKYGQVRTRAEYIYGDTDSVFYTFNLEELDGTRIRGKKALEITIELAQEVGDIAGSFLKEPHDFEYEKTFMPFCLLSKKRYVGMLYEKDPNKCKRKEMGIVLKRRDNAPIVKDVYGGIIDILMKKQDIGEAIQFLRDCLHNIVNEQCPMDKLVITKSLRSGYKNPKAIAHKVLADRMAARDPGNKPSSGDRIPFAYIAVNNKHAKQGDRIETPTYILEHGLKLDYSHYITNQIMKPILQLFALVVEDIWKMQNKLGMLRQHKKDVAALRVKVLEQYNGVESVEMLDKFEDKLEDLRCKEVKKLLFDEYLRITNNERAGVKSITHFFKAKA